MITCRLPSNAKHVLVFLFLFCSTMLRAQTYFREDAKFAYLGNEKIEVVFEKSSNYGIYSLIDKESGIDFRQYKVPINFHSTPRLFAIEGLDETKSVRYIENIHAQTCQISLDTLSNGLRLKVFFSQLYSNQILATATIELQDHSPRINFNISITNNQSLILRAISYPILTGFTKIGNDASNDFLAFPDEDGVLFSNPYEAITNLDYHSIWMEYPVRISMQFFALYDGQAGLYFSTEDPDYYTKRYVIENWDQDADISLMMVHLMDEAPSNTLEFGYSRILEVFHGDWYDAADIYKKWTRQQDWCRSSILEDSSTPKWFSEAATFMDIANYNMQTNLLVASPDEISKSNISYQKAFNQKIITGVYCWEKDGPWVAPFSFPPRDGDQQFSEMQKIIHNNFSSLHLPIASSFMDSRSPNYNAYVEPYAVIRDDGSYESQELEEGWYTKFKMTKMCIYTQPWQDVLIDEVRNAAVRGVDAIHIDKFPFAMGCYNPDHGHSIGWGKWAQESTITFLDQALNTAKSINPNAILLNEWGSELYLPYIHSYFTRSCIAEDYHYEWIFKNKSTIKAQPIPLFPYLYHPFVLPRAPEVVALKQWHPDDYHFLVLARNLIFGSMGGFAVHNNERVNDISDSDLNDYKRIMHAYADYAHGFLFGTEMLNPPQIDVPEITILSAWNNYPAKTPAVLHSVWKSPNNSVGYLFVNVSERNQNFDVLLSNYNLPFSESCIYAVRNGQYQIIDKKANLPQTIHLELAPKDVLLVALTESLSDSLDLAFHDNSLFIQSERFSSGQIVECNAVVYNESDSLIHPITVKFYKGDPQHGGKVVGQEKTIAQIAPHGSGIAKMNYFIETPEDLNLYAVIDSENLIQETNETNNTVQISLKPNLHAPSITQYFPTSDTTIVETDSLILQVSVTDLDQSPLFYTWTINGVVDTTAQGSTFLLQTSYVSSGKDTITMRITDGLYSAEHRWLITIQDKPTFRILFDESHGELHSLSLERAKTLTYNTPDFTHWKRFREWAIGKYEINSQFAGDLTESAIRDYHVIIMATPTRALTNQEKIALSAYLSNGGSLLILADVFAPPVNDFTTEFGIRYDGFTLVDSTNDNGALGLLTLFNQEHPITKNLDTYDYSWGNSLTVTGQAKSLAWTPANVYQDKNSNLKRDENESIGSFIYLAAAEVGSGRLLCMADNSFFDWAWQIQGNHRMMARILNWLTENQTVTLVEQTHSNSEVIEEYRLFHNYPNPFNASTTIEYQIPEETKVTITIFNVLGQAIITLFDDYQKRGKHRIDWDGSDFQRKRTSSGLYFLRMETSSFDRVIKFIVLK